MREREVGSGGGCGCGCLSDELVTGVDEQLQVGVELLNFEPGQVWFAKCDPGDGDGVDLVVLAAAAARSSAGGRGMGGDVHHVFAGVEQPPGGRQTEALRSFDGDQPVSAEGGDPVDEPIELGDVSADFEQPENSAVLVDDCRRVAAGVGVNADDDDETSSMNR